MKTVRKTIINILLWIISLTFIFPIIWLIYSSFKTSAEFSESVIKLPSALNIENYKTIFTVSDMPKYILNSVFTAGISVILILFFSYCIGYFLARVNFRLSKVVYGCFLIGMLIPVHSLMVPMYVIFSKTGLNDHFFTLILPYVAFEMPIAIYMIESSVRGIPKEMEEAAAIDGCPFAKTMFQIILPMARPSLTAAGIITFFYCWNEFSFALVLTTQEKLRTIPLGLTLFNGSYTTNFPMLMSAMVVAVCPALIIYMIFSKNIIEGMMAGAVKG